MANEFKIKKGLIVTGADGGTVVDIQGSQGQLFSVTDDLSGSIFAVSDISGVPIMDVNSNGTIQFSDLGAGTLVTDANGNISVSSGGGAGGPYLPLAGGRMTTTAKIEFYNATQYIQANSTNDLTLASGDDINFKSNYNRFYNGTTEYARLSGSTNSWLANGSGGKIGISTTTPVETLTVPGGEGVMLGFKRFYSDTGTVPAGIGSGFALTADLNTEQGTTLTSQYQYKFYLTTTGTGTYNSSVYIVYRNSADTAWDVHRVSATGLSSNHPELTVSGTSALIYNDHPSAYGVYYRVETSYTGQAKTSPEIFGSDYMWTRDNTDLHYMGGNVGIGTTSPVAKLEVKKSSYNAVNAIANFVNGNDPVRVSYDTVVIAQTDVPTLSIVETIDGSQANEQKLTFSVGDNKAVIASTSTATSGMYFNVNRDVDAPGYNTGNGTIALKISNNGNVGIGTTNPIGNLNINGGTGDAVAQDSVLNLTRTSSTGNVYSAKLKLVEGASTTHGDLRFQVKTTASSAEDPTYYTDAITIKGNTANVGIGTTSPDHTLMLEKDVDGEWEALRLFNYHSDGSTVGSVAINMDVRASNGQIARASIKSKESTADSPYSELGFFTSNTTSTAPSERMTIDKDGNVGIGTTSPVAKLDLAGKAHLMRLIHSNGYIEFLDTGGGNRTGYLQLNSNSSSALNVTVNQALHFATNNSNRLTIAANGNVGIGTTVPGEKLTVSGNGRFSNGSAGTLTIKHNYGYHQPNWGIKLDGDTGTTGGYLSQYINLGGFALEQGGTYYGGGPWKTDANSTSYSSVNGTNGKIVFYTNTSLTADTEFTPSERMRIASNGNVGIGTTNPRDTLEIVGNMRFVEGEDHLMIKPNSNIHGADFIVGDGVAATDTPVMSLNGLYGGQVTIQTQGNTIADKTVLDIQGTQGQLFSVTDNLSGDIFSVADISGVPIMNVNSDGTSYFDGNVGIGTDSPGAKLEVLGNIILRQSATNSETVYISTNARGGGTADADLRLGNSNNGDVLTIHNENVGIGTTIPSKNLSVAGDVIFGQGQDRPVTYRSLDGNFRITPNSGGWSTGYFFDNYSGTFVGGFGLLGSTDTPNYFWIGDNYNDTTMVIKPNAGNVGIGTNSPGVKLDVSDVIRGRNSIRVDGAITGSPYFGLYQGGEEKAYIQYVDTGDNFTMQSDGIITLKTGSTERVRVTTGGNVGINTNNPAYLLDVRNGTLSGAIARFSAINPHVIIESTSAGPAVLHFKPNATGNKSGQFKVTTGEGYNFRWSNDAASTAEVTYMKLDTSTTGGGDLTVKGDIIAYGAPSDERYKENIKPIESALDKALKLQGVTFDWKESDSILDIKEDIGFIAQDVQKVIPELVRENEDGKLSLRYQGVTPILLEAIKELKAEIEELKKQIK